MNKSEPQLRTNPRIVPQDLLLKFGYSPDNGIKFDSVASTLGFYQGGARRVDITSFGLAVRNGEGLVVGHTAQVNAGLGALEFEVLGTADVDSSMLIGRWGNNDQAPTLSFTKSRDPVIADGTFAIVSDGDEIGRLYFTADDGTDLFTAAAQIHVEVDGTPGANDMPGRIIFSTTKDGAASVTEALRIDSSQNVQMRNESYLWIGPDSAAAGFADGNTTVGIVINQEANDNSLITLKSSDVAHGYTGFAETDTFLEVRKSSSTLGGVLFNVTGEDGLASPVRWDVRAGTTANTNHGAGARGMFELQLSENNEGIVDAGGNLFVIRRRVAGPATNAAFIVDAEGDLFADSGTSTNAVTVFDNEDDISLVRAFDVARSDAGNDGLIRDQWDQWLGSNEADLVSHGILGAPLAEGGLVNVTRLQQLHNGAIWQQHTAHMSLVERVDSLAVELTEAKQQLAALTA